MQFRNRETGQVKIEQKDEMKWCSADEIAGWPIALVRGVLWVSCENRLSEIKLSQKYAV